MKKHKSKSMGFFITKKFMELFLYLGGKKSLCVFKTEPFLRAFIKDFCIFDLVISSIFFRRGLKVLYKTILSGEKILFIGKPIGLEREFSDLCKKHQHYIIEEDVPDLISNFSGSKSSMTFFTYPSLIFIVCPSKNPKVIGEVSKLDIPVMGFVDTSFYLDMDFPLPANIYSRMGSFFIYSLFVHIFNFKI